MKMKHRMFLALTLSASIFANTLSAQVATPATQDAPPPPVIPAGDVPAPLTSEAGAKKAATKKKAAAKPKPKATADKKAAEPEKPVATIGAGPAVAREKNVNVRAQALINSEIVTHLKRGDLVNVIEEITLKKAKTDEPARWAKVSLPAGTVVWVNTQFIDPAAKTVKPKRLNMRSGPGENYSVLGRLDRGNVVKEVEIKGEWMKIEAPTNSYAFVAAHLLSTDPADLGPALAKANPPAPAVVTPAPVTETVVVATTPVPPPADPITPAPATPPALQPVVVPPPPPATTLVVPPPPPAPVDETPIKRIVTREGFVKGSASIQAPTYFVLRSLDNNKTINYLHSHDTNHLIKDFQLQRVIVVGEEILDERWPNTPVIDVESIEVVP